MTEVKIKLNELTNKVLNNAITGSRVIEEKDKDRLYLSMKGNNLVLGLIYLLGKPMIYGSIGIGKVNDYETGNDGWLRTNIGSLGEQMQV